MPGEISIPDGPTQGETMRDIVDLTVKMLRRVAQIQVKVGLGEVMADEPPRAFRAISIAFRGSVKIEYLLLVDRQSAVAIAGGMLAADASAEDDDSIVDGVKEFANIACGNIMALMAKKGRTLDISPPREEVFHIDGYNIIRGRRAVSFPLVSAEGEMTLILAEG
jgi:CheY-specific phosphatase CheX